MKRITKPGKLTLNRTTLRHLTSEDLADVAGGSIGPPSKVIVLCRTTSIVVALCNVTQKCGVASAVTC